MERILALAAEAGIDSMAWSPGPLQRRRATRSLPPPTTKPMEQMLWDAACSIRGEKDAAKFKDYLLPLLFLKRLSDVFDDEIARLAEEYGDRETALEIAEADHSLLRFYLPPEARGASSAGGSLRVAARRAMAEHDSPKDIGEHLTKAVRAVVKQNPTLSGVIDVVDFAAERNGERDINPAKLRGVVETFSDPRYRLGLADVQPDFLGRAYEYLLRKFAEGSGQSAGEFFTPTEVGFLIAHILRPRPGEECHDYACGSAGLLVKLQLVARELDPTSKVPLKLYGQELQAESYAVAQMNAIIHDMDVEIARGDTMINPKFRDGDGKTERFDIVVANPMWNQPFDPDIFANDPFDRFRTAGGVTTGKGDWAWLQHTLACHGRSRPRRRGARHRRGHARLGLEERGQGAQHPQVVRRPGPDRRRDPAAGQSVLQHHRRRRDRGAEQAQARRAQGQDRSAQCQPHVHEGQAEELHPEEDIRATRQRLSQGRSRSMAKSRSSAKGRPRKPTTTSAPPVGDASRRQGAPPDQGHHGRPP